MGTRNKIRKNYQYCMNNIFDANVCTMLKRDERQNVKIICFKMKKWNFC